MNRADFLRLLASLPLLGFLKPREVEAKQTFGKYQQYADAFNRGENRADFLERPPHEKRAVIRYRQWYREHMGRNPTTEETEDWLQMCRDVEEWNRQHGWHPARTPVGLLL